MGKNTLNWITVELAANLLNHLSDTGVGLGLSNHSLGGLEGVPGGLDGISLSSCDLTLSNSNCSCSIGSISIDVGSTHNFCNITLLKLGGFITEWRIMSHDMINGDASWEGNTSLKILGLL